ncbi:MAG: cation-transporting P-type ATPase [Alphaproteobacteria bacterium]
MSADAVAAMLETDPTRGLDDAEIDRRQLRCGPNLLQTHVGTPFWHIVAHQFTSVLVWLLIGAMVLAVVFGDWLQGIAIGVVIAINALIGVVTESRAVRSMEALRRIGRTTTRVRRAGHMIEVAAEALVPGDILLLEGGDIVTADARLIEATNMAIDESLLTGESEPVEKRPQPLAPETRLADRACMAFRGTAITGGVGTAIVTATAMQTEIGRISSLVASVGVARTPLERQLNVLSSQLIWLTLGVAVVIAFAGIADGRPWLMMVQTAIALAVAAVPEGLPMVSTLALARGMWRMARRNALLDSLPAVETLGATTVICCDKTGTLTENRMTVESVMDAAGGISQTADIEPGTTPGAFAVLECATLCNRAEVERTDGLVQGIGDPLEVALLLAAGDAGIEIAGLRARLPKLDEDPFDSTSKMMATSHQAANGLLIAVKGAPEAIITRATRIDEGNGIRVLTDDDRAAWRGRIDELAGRGLRMLAIARCEDGVPGGDPYEDLEFLGLVAMRDPPRLDVRDALAQCRAAGIRVVMVTGDHGLTARAIARDVGLDDSDGWHGGENLGRLDTLDEAAREELARATIFARVTPEEKLRLVEFLQGRGEVVAMTGDGVNDAPALKRADMGVAMGVRGTPVAREAADMVLRDDSFATIVFAIEQGRVIFTNIRKFVFYLLSCNLSEILVVGLATLGGLPLPLLPLQILFLNLVTDVFPAFALSACEGAPDVMDRPPRPPGEPVLPRRRWIAVALHGGAITLATLAALFIAIQWLGYDDRAAVTVSFLTLAFAQLWHVFNMRERRSGLLVNEVTRNPYVWGALALCTGLLLAATYLPGLSHVLKVVPPDGAGWAVVLGASLAPLVFANIAVMLRRR